MFCLIFNVEWKGYTGFENSCKIPLTDWQYTFLRISSGVCLRATRRRFDLGLYQLASALSSLSLIGREAGWLSGAVLHTSASIAAANLTESIELSDRRLSHTIQFNCLRRNSSHCCNCLSFAEPSLCSRLSWETWSRWPPNLAVSLTCGGCLNDWVRNWALHGLLFFVQTLSYRKA